MVDVVNNGADADAVSSALLPDALKVAAAVVVVVGALTGVVPDCAEKELPEGLDTPVLVVARCEETSVGDGIPEPPPVNVLSSWGGVLVLPEAVTVPVGDLVGGVSVAIPEEGIAGVLDADAKSVPVGVAVVLSAGVPDKLVGDPELAVDTLKELVTPPVADTDASAVRVPVSASDGKIEDPAVPVGTLEALPVGVEETVFADEPVGDEEAEAMPPEAPDSVFEEGVEELAPETVLDALPVGAAEPVFPDEPLLDIDAEPVEPVFAALPEIALSVLDAIAEEPVPVTVLEPFSVGVVEPAFPDEILCDIVFAALPETPVAVLD
ncbi:hypothetical protein LOZ41_006894, partial [Ophidiomyces ophidiicola]